MRSCILEEVRLRSFTHNTPPAVAERPSGGEEKSITACLGSTLGRFFDESCKYRPDVVAVQFEY